MPFILYIYVIINIITGSEKNKEERISNMDYQALYQSKCVSAREIADHVTDNYRIVMDLALAEPKAIVDAICRKVKEEDIRGVQIEGGVEVYPYGYFTDPDLIGKIKYVSWFSNPFARNLVNKGIADIWPSNYRDGPRLTEGFLAFDAVVITVSPMDEHGYFSFGVTGSQAEAFMKASKHTFLEVNPNMPRALHGPIVHISQVDLVCENEFPLVELPQSPPTENTRKIAGFIAEEIGDGACLQLGIGAIPDAVGMELKDKKHLGIHTEMFTSSMVDLIECGAVDNSRKKICPGRSVATFAFGAQKVYQYINNNPAVYILPVDYVNDPYVIGQNDNMACINSAVEVDFYGQVCAESSGSYHISGSGGQPDYIRGALQSKGGKSFIAFESTAKEGTVSKINPTLKTGAIVTSSKNEVDYVVTEYGIARLRGKTIGQRAKALISIAHPKFREEMTWQAKKMNLMV